MRPPPRRRAVALGLLAAGGAAALAGCSGGRPFFASMFDEGPRDGVGPVRTPDYAKVYGRMAGERFPIPAFDYTAMDPAHLRANVAYRGTEPAGTIVIDPLRHALYYVEDKGRATRYGAGIHREGFSWSGWGVIGARRAWPDWLATADAVERDPALATRLSDVPGGRGVPGGSRSPLGARALYVSDEWGDTGYYIHGTNEPETVGTDVPIGCVRLINQDVVHLYGRAAQGGRVLVLA